MSRDINTRLTSQDLVPFIVALVNEKILEPLRELMACSRPAYLKKLHQEKVKNSRSELQIGGARMHIVREEQAESGEAEGGLLVEAHGAL